jgi:pimeloyl-ACP methyl ester carboxylesterase
LNYVSGARYGLAVANGQSVAQNFSLTPLPGAPVVTPVTRPPEAPATIVNSQLKRWNGSSWVTVTSVADIDRAKQTVVMTHGWNSSADGWPADMAQNFFLSQANDAANVLAWDWSDNADTGLLLSLAYSRTPGQGRRLAQTLTNLLGTGYVQGIHFIGHSLGTLVNATAADYLHKKTSGAFDYHRTQMTLLDNAEMANVEGRLLPVGYKVAGFESFLGLGDPPPLGWVSPLPEQRQWADNYISLVGLYHVSVVNAWLPKGIAYGAQINPAGWAIEAHGYACDWYGDTAGNTSLSILGNRHSFERLGVNGQFPSPSPYPVGSLYVQYTANDYALMNVNDVPGYLVQTATEFAKSKLLDGLNWLTDTGEKIGDAVVDVVESGVAVAVDVAGDVQQGASWIVSQSIASLRATLRSAASVLPLQQPGVPLAWRGGPLGPNDYTNSPSAVWLPVEIPTNAALFSFDFTFTGDGGQDVLSASIGGTNVFALEAQDMPEGQLLDSGPIAVSQWQGQTLELFFGLLGGTSTNTTISITGMRFYQIDPPFLTAHLAGTNLVVSWPGTVTGYSLQSGDSLTNSAWSAVTNVPTLSGMRQYVTNTITGEIRFYRLKRN